MSTDTVKNTPLKWHGGKKYLAKWLHSLVPLSVIDDPEHGYTHRNIVFGGGLGEFWNWQPVEGISEAVNDINFHLTSLWNVLRGDKLFQEFRQILDSTPFSQWEFDASQFTEKYRQHLSNGYSPALAAVFFIQYRQSCQGLGKDYATPTTRTRRGMNENVSAWLSAVEGLPECHERLKRVEIRNLDFAKFIEAYDHPRALFYCDPPYLHETRTSTDEYSEHEMSEDEHDALLTDLTMIEGRFMLSGYHSHLYDHHASNLGWTCHECEIDNKASSAKEKPKRTECVWTNY